MNKILQLPVTVHRKILLLPVTVQRKILQLPVNDHCKILQLSVTAYLSLGVHITQAFYRNGEQANGQFFLCKIESHYLLQSLTK